MFVAAETYYMQRRRCSLRSLSFISLAALNITKFISIHCVIIILMRIKHKINTLEFSLSRYCFVTHILCNCFVCFNRKCVASFSFKIKNKRVQALSSLWAFTNIVYLDCTTRTFVD